MVNINNTFTRIVVFSLYFSFIVIALYKIPVVKAANKTIEIGLASDLYVESGYPNTITYNQRNLFLGYDTSYSKYITRIYFKPNYASLKNKNITPEQIVSVKTNFHIYLPNQNTLKVRVYKVTAPWSQEEVTYNSQPSSSYYTYKNLTPDSNTLQASLTNAFKQDYSRYIDENTSYGFMLRLADENNPAIRIWSTECLKAPGEHCSSPNDRPTILVEYKDNTVPQIGEIIGPANNYKTNEHTVAFVFKQASDPDNDKLYYRIVAALDPDFTHIIKTSNWIEDSQLFSQNNNETATITLNLSDNVWYWRLEVKDIYNNKAVSTGKKLTVDTTPPEIPMLSPEPPYTKGTSNTIYLNVPSYEDGELFQYQIATKSDFSDAITTEWTPNLSYTFKNLKNIKYYYRARAIDSLGNISNWSKNVSSTQDNTKPALVYFKVSKSIVGPNDKILTLRARFYDPTLSKVRVSLYNSSSKLMLSYEEQESTYISKEFNIEKLTSGVYFVYAQAIDEFGYQTTSKPIKIIIDRDPPKLSVSGVFVSKKYINTGKVQAHITCKDSQLPTKTYVYLNNKKLKETNEQDFYYLFYLKDKAYHLKVTCKDSANNTTSKDLYFVIDTHPPASPQFKYQLNKDKTQATVYTKCKTGETLHLFFNRKKHTAACLHGSAKYTLKGLGPGNTYSISGFLIDKAGNRSPSSSLSFTIPKPVPKSISKPITINCYVEYDATKYSYITYKCSYKKAPIYKIMGYYAYGKYIYNISGNLPQHVNLLFKEITCKPFSLWDIRTWFSCVPITRTIYSTKAFLSFTGFIDNKPVPIKYINKNKITFSIKSATPLKEKTLILKSMLLKAYIPISAPGALFLKIKNPIELKQKLHFPYVRKPINTSKPLSWMFKRGRYRITQWFGHTCYRTWHKGIDIGVYKLPVYASAEGRIASFGMHHGTKQLSGGYWVAIKHPFGLYTYYWHLDPVGTKRLKPYIGKWVKRGQLIAISGNTGWFKGVHNPYHLHFEVRTGKYARKYLDPTKYLNVDWNKIPVCRAKCCSSGNDPRRR